MKYFYSVGFSLIFLLLACQEKEFKTEEKIKPTDSVYYFYEKAKKTDSLPQKIRLYNKGLQQVEKSSDTLLPLLLDHKIYYLNRLKEYDSALFFADSLQRVANFQKDTARIALAFYRKAVINRYLDNQEAVFRNAFNSRQLYLQIGDSSKGARRSLEMAIAQSRMQDYTGSQESATEALSHLNAEKDSEYLISAYNVIAITYRNQGFYGDAIKEYQNALAFATHLEDSLVFINNIGLVYRDQKDYEKAISLFEEIYSKVPEEDNKARARYFDNLTFTKWLKNPNEDVSAQLLKPLQWRSVHNDIQGLISSYNHLSKFYENRNIARAIYYAENWLQAGKSGNSLQSQVDALELLIKIQPGNAEYVTKYMRLNDSLTTANLQAKNTFAKIRFDEERKKQQISRLEASAALQAVEKQEIKTRNYILVFFAVLVIGFAVFIIYYNRQKYKKEKIREIYNTETRISKIIHDELANDVYNVMSSMEAIAPTETMDKLEQIYSRTRSISRENSEITTGPGYIDHLIGSLSSICPEDTRIIISGERLIPWDRLKPEKKFVIYRVLQEIMVNMRKHSKASLVALVFIAEEKQVIINYSDNGEGASRQAIKNGNGLQNVENRIFSINGKLTFETEKDKGFKVMLNIPL